MKKTKRVYAATALCLCILLTAVFLGGVLLSHAHESCVENCTLAHIHQHCEKDCIVCTMAEVYRRALGGLLLCAILYQTMAAVGRVARRASVRLRLHPPTPVYLKTKLSN